MKNYNLQIPAAMALALILVSCDPAPTEKPDISPQDLFFERLTLLCGKAFAGQLVSEQEVDADMAGKPMVMHVAKCTQKEIQIPFHISEGDSKWNRSRTWIVTRTSDGLRLKHQHKHEDGSFDDVTNYGGDTNSVGTKDRQEFPIDAETIESFKENGLEQSLTNIWATEISAPGQTDAMFAYELRRPASAGGRHFRVEFDLSTPVTTPPAAWGS